MVVRLRHQGIRLVAILRLLWVATADLYDIVSSGNLEALRKGSNMTECTTEGCGDEARVTVRRKTSKIPVAQDGVVILNGISVPVRKGETLMIPGDDRRVCKDCGNFMIAVCGYESDRLRLVQ